jgi:hypothetical protein
LKKLHIGNVQQNVDDVVVLAVSSSRSDPTKRHKWRRLREMHTCSTPTTPPPESSEIWWSGRWDRQHDAVVSMVKSMHQQFTCLHDGRRMEKGTSKTGQRLHAKLVHDVRYGCAPFIGRCRTFLEYESSNKSYCLVQLVQVRWILSI